MDADMEVQATMAENGREGIFVTILLYPVSILLSFIILMSITPW
jgi:hypothetical protein